MKEEKPQYRVHLVDEAVVVPRGEQVRVWFLPFRDGWIRAKDHPECQIEEARSERRDEGCPAGTIWRREIELQLDPRCPLLSRVTSPLIEDLGTMDYLTREKHSMRRHVEETWFIVVGNYRLMKSEEPPSFSRAREVHHAAAEPRRESHDKARN